MFNETGKNVMNVQSLSDLKAENEPDVTEDVVDDVVEDEVTEPTEPTEEEPVIEAWQADNDEGAIVDSVPVATHAKVRGRLKEKVKERDDEISNLKEQMAKLQAGNHAQTLNPVGEPKIEDFMHEAHPEAAYAKAYFKWERDNEVQTSQIAQQQQARQEAQLKQNQAIDSHYERMQKLAETSNISADIFKNAELNVRKTVNEVFSGQGDEITDGLIATLGDGSEKVIPLLGKNAEKLSHFKSLLNEDPSGLKASMYLGRLSVEAKQPIKRKSQAPAPAPNVNGGTVTAKESTFKKKYAEAHRKGNAQEAYNIKREAKAAGINPKKW